MTDFCFITHQVLSFDERMMVSFAFFRKTENSGYECPELLIGFRGFELYCLCGTIHNTGIASVTMMVPNWTFIQNAYIAVRAYLCACAATDTPIVRIKPFIVFVLNRQIGTHDFLKASSREG